MRFVCRCVSIMSARIIFALCGAAAAALPSVPIDPAAYAWLLNESTSLLTRCTLRANDNTTIFTPDASSSYGAQWTRDFAMAVINAAPALKAAKLDVRAAVAYTLDRVSASGVAPDRVQANGEAVFAPGPPGDWPIKLAWDNMPYSALLLTAYAREWSDAAFFCAFEPTARRAIDVVPLDGGLAFNDPSSPNCSFGFEDSVILPGRMLTVSLLLYDAATQLAALARALGCGDVGHYEGIASAVAGGVDSLFDDASGLFFASSETETVPDVFGSAYVVALNLSTAQRRASVSAFFAAQWHASTAQRHAAAQPGVTTTIFQEGQARHLPYPLFWKACWTGCPAPGTYQNGAFWATPLNWILPALVAGGFVDEATQVADAVVASFQAGGVMEAINRDIHYHGVVDYVASACNVLGAVAPRATSGHDLGAVALRAHNDADTPVLVGAWYFSGWFTCSTPNCYSHFQGYSPTGASVENFFPYYAERVPLLGNDTTLESTIVAEVHAADAALDFFHVLFYDDDGERDCGNPDPNLSPCLDTALAFMMNSTSVWEGVTRLRFAVAYSNDVDRSRDGQFVGDAGRTAWLSRVSTWTRAFSHARYLAVGGRPIFSVLIPDIFVNVQCSGNVSLAEELLELLRAAGRDAGVGAPVIGGGWLEPAQPPDVAPRPHPDGYMLYAGTDVPCGGSTPCDIRTASGSVGDCIGLCNATAGCVAFAFYTGNSTCVLKDVAGPGAPGPLSDTYVRVAADVAWEWRSTYNDAEPLCYDSDGGLEECAKYRDSWFPNATPTGARVFPYADVLVFQAQARGNQSNDAVPYLPNVIAGFDPRPWEEHGPSFMRPTRAEWTAALTQARDFVLDAANHVFGFPDATSPTGVTPAINVYAWNEYGEGGIMAPSEGDGTMKLDVIREVFGR